MDITSDDANINKGEKAMIKLTLKDGSVREIESAQPAAEIIKEIFEEAQSLLGGASKWVK